MKRWGRFAVTAGLGLDYVVLLVAAVAAVAPLFLAAAVVAVVGELVLSRRAPLALPGVLNSRLGVRFRVLSLDMLTALLAARLWPAAPKVVALALLALMLLSIGRDGSGVFARRAAWWRAGGPVSWRNLHVPGLRRPAPLVAVREPDLPLTLLTLVIPLGYTVGFTPDRYGGAIAAQWFVIVAVLLVLLGRGVEYAMLTRRTPDQVREAVRAALEAAAPEVVVHHSGRRGTVEQVRLWLPALAALDRRCLIVVRESSHLDALDGCGIPVVWAPRAQDVELFMVPTIDLALYPSDATNINNHLLRVTGVYDVLIGHGDSDEPESRSPVARMYDEIWVAGAAGRRRYAYPASGVADEKIREIGPIRPLRPSRVPARHRPTVVYAPSWENTVGAVDLSSLLTRGEQVLDALLARQDVRLLFVPAAAAGSRLPAYADACQRLRRRLLAAQADHAALPADRLPEALQEAAFAVVDVSPALAEAVRADVPFAVPAVERFDEPAMREAFPSVAGGAVLTGYPHDVFAALDDALGPDSHAADRLALGRDLDAPIEVLGAFRLAVDEAIATQRRRRAFARPAAV